MLRLINDEDAKVPVAVAAVLPALATAVDLAVEALSGGHRIHYFGAGTSGRIAVLDAAELIPTFGLDPVAGGRPHRGRPAALERPIEDAEDDEAGGAGDAGDVVRRATWRSG